MKLLNYEIKSVVKVDYHDVENLIRETYGHDYEIMPMEEVGSSQYAATYDVDVDGEVEDEEGLQSLIDGKPEQWILRDIMNDMCRRNMIPKAEYIIGVNW